MSVHETVRAVPLMTLGEVNMMKLKIVLYSIFCVLVTSCVSIQEP